jgi:uncharacterized protein (TIGR00255 family)
MSLRSMTGHGRGMASSNGVKVEVELSSVNRKQMDVSVSLPRSLTALEPLIYEEIHKTLMRGRITGEVVIRFSTQARRKAVCVDDALAETYLAELRRTTRRLKLQDDFNGSILLNLPDVLRYEQPADTADKVWPIVSKALKAALKALVRMRTREGSVLQKDIERRFDKIVAALDRIKKQAPNVTKHYREKLRSRLKDAGFTVETSDERVLRELALFADRSDITEEVTRFDSHIHQARQLMQSDETVGRSLDFLAQEMFREVNTMGSKANDSGILRDVVGLKAELERIREQVQNIE